MKCLHGFVRMLGTQGWLLFRVELITVLKTGRGRGGTRRYEPPRGDHATGGCLPAEGFRLTRTGSAAARRQPRLATRRELRALDTEEPRWLMPQSGDTMGRRLFLLF